MHGQPAGGQDEQGVIWEGVEVVVGGDGAVACLLAVEFIAA